MILRRVKPPRRNISKEEHEALKNLRNKASFVILKDDKGGATMIINHEDYKVKMIENLNLSGRHKNLTGNPISRITRGVKKVIKGSNIDERPKNIFLPSY